MRSIAFVIATGCWMATTSTLNAADVADVARRIDQHVERQLDETDVTPTAVLSDAPFLRRITLDLAGRVPTIAEIEAYTGSTATDKRERLVESLIHSPDFAFHQRNEIDTLLLRRLQNNDAWRGYLLEATRQNRSWDQLFREIMLPEVNSPGDDRPAAFLAQRIRDLDATTNDASILWFGVNVGCAKCHDHPLVYDWTQAHYYGMASFFKRTFRTRKGAISERLDGRLKYSTTDGEEFDADFMFLTGTTVEEPESKLGDDERKKLREAIKQSERDEKAPPPPRPEFQPRAELVKLALTENDERFLAKNIVNRTWARLLGRGLVHPLDQMHSENPPSHPELLEQLANDLVEHQYDLRRLVHAIVLSDTYRRRPADPADADRGPELFSAALPRALSPHQLSLSCLVATASPESMVGLNDGDSWASQRESLEQRSESNARTFAIPDHNFQVPVDEALWFSNNAAVQNDLLGSQPQKLVGYLSRFDSDADAAIRACKAVLGRAPSGDELTTVTRYLADRADHRNNAIAQVVWAWLSSPEFRFNH